MIRATTYGAVVLFVGCALVSCVPRPAAVPAAPADPAFQLNVARRISVEETVARVAAGEPAIYLDTRERVVGPMIEGAVNVPSSWLDKWAQDQPKDAFIVAYCACLHEASAAVTVLDLQRQGFTNAYALLGGMRAWAAAGHPIAVKR
jgi:rhodanese-related sulfurtransferase